MQVSIRIREDAKGVAEPERMSDGASGFDIKAAIDAPKTLESGATTLVPAGIFLSMPKELEAQVRPRSGLAAKHGITVLNAPGTIDSDYRGEVKVILINHNANAFVIEPGMRIAQLVFAEVTIPEVQFVDSLDETARSAGGFGHTGI